MRTAAFVSLFAILGAVSALPEPVKAGSIAARDAGMTPALEGIGALVARGDDGKGHDYCWDDQYGNEKCGKYCCKKYETCCGDYTCCQKGYKCYKKGKDDYGKDDYGKDDYGKDDYGKDEYGKDDGHKKRGDDDYGKGYKWYCKKEDYEHNW